MTKLLSVGLVALIAWAVASYQKPPAQATSARSTSFIAQHTNGILERKCLRPYSSLHGTRASWIRRHVAAHRRMRGECAPAVPWYVTKQIAAATVIGRESRGDPWPNCPDPFDGGGSWSDTVACENRRFHELYGYPREWLDSPGYYRCGLQFDPGWEARFGRLCP